MPKRRWTPTKRGRHFTQKQIQFIQDEARRILKQFPDDPREIPISTILRSFPPEVPRTENVRRVVRGVLQELVEQVYSVEQKQRRVPPPEKGSNVPHPITRSVQREPSLLVTDPGSLRRMRERDRLNRYAQVLRVESALVQERWGQLSKGEKTLYEMLQAQESVEHIARFTRVPEKQQGYHLKRISHFLRTGEWPVTIR